MLRASMRERTFRTRLLAQVLERGTPARVLDVGTGTGSLAIALCEGAPVARVVALDPDERILARARAKADPGLPIEWVRGRAQELPFADGTFEAVTCSLVLHHLEPPAKLLALAECLRVLVPGGRLHVADWGEPHGPLMRLAFLGVQLLDGFAATRDHVKGLLPQTIERAGFADVRVRERLRTFWGSLELISARRPQDAESEDLPRDAVLVGAR